MKISSATFVISSTSYQGCPAPDKPEYAFVGRSNVGKSSLINMLVGRKKLAKTSSHPGKTQTINHFLVNENWYLVDLPGYGYAKISKKMREEWQVFIRDYVLYRENLGCVFVLVDSSIPLQKIDLEFLEWLGEKGVAFAIVFTKTDKEKRNIINKHVATFKERILENWEELPPVFLTSAGKKEGAEEILTFIEEVSRQFG
ncbi:MAG: ribosome biogenesis GTP-binding protein YihA/YsxC [Bacteroidia bacterium]